MNKWIIGSIVGALALACVAAVAVPKLSAPRAAAQAPTEPSAREAELRSDLSALRNAEYKFFTDTNYYPLTLADLCAKSPAELSVPNTALDGSGHEVKIAPKPFHGPYIDSIP